MQAVSNLLEDEVYRGYLTDNAVLVFTIISDTPDSIRAGLDTLDAGRLCKVMTYTSDSHCMEEAHSHEMSFGKYRAYLELNKYDISVTVEECHDMSMGEIQERIEGCRQHEETEHSQNHGNSNMDSGSESHGNQGGHHGGHHNN